jgi:ribonuclease BN (tRNA processing enzyme)
MPEIVILGSSCGDPSADRANACVLIGHGDRYLQFDAGEGCSASMKRHRIDYACIDNIFITHMHPDHITGLFMEIQMMFLAGRRHALEVFLPDEALGPVEGFMRATYLFDEKMGFETRLHPVPPGAPINAGDAVITAHHNTHLSKYGDVVKREGAPNRLQSYSYTYEAAGVKFLYSGDIGSADDYTELLSGCDVVITEGIHIGLDVLFEKVAQNGVRHLILTHLSDDMYRSPDSIIVSAQKQGVKSIYIAKDGLVLSV